MALELARHVGQRPDGHARFALAGAKRPNADAQPTAFLTFMGADAHFLLAAAAFTGRFQKPVDRLGNARIADEHALDRANIVGIRRRDQREVSGIGKTTRPLTSVTRCHRRPIDHGLEQRARSRSSGTAKYGREREQQKHADHGQESENRENVGLRVSTTDEQKTSPSGHEKERNEQHETDAPAGVAHHGPIDGRANGVVGQLHRERL
jgi:hypothetical protein